METEYNDISTSYILELNLNEENTTPEHAMGPVEEEREPGVRDTMEVEQVMVHMETQLQHLEIVLGRLEHVNMKVKVKTCHIGLQEASPSSGSSVRVGL